MVQLTDSGLAFEAQVDAQEREEHLEIAGAPLSAKRLQQIVRRPPTRCVVNPAELPPGELRRRMEANKRDKFNLGYQLPETYDRAWTPRPDELGPMEGQAIVVVAFDGREPAGYALMELSVNRLTRWRTVGIWAPLHMVFVDQSRRGRGFGIDLALAAGRLLQELVVATGRAMRAGWKLEATVYAEYESVGGERFATSLLESLELQFDLLDEVRPDIRRGEVRLDAGY